MMAHPYAFRSIGLASPLILMPRPMAPKVVDALARNGGLVKLWEASDVEAELSRVATEVGALAIGGHIKVDGAFMGRFPSLQIVSSFGVGYDSIDVAAAAKRGIIVTNTPDVLTEEVADTPLGLLLTRGSENATVTLCHTGTRDLAAHVRTADIVVAAAGVPGIITADMVKPGAAVLDVGVSRVDGKVTGDVHPDVWDVAGWVSPNPKGVGPMTRAMLLTNIVEIAEKSVRS